MMCFYLHTAGNEWNFHCTCSSIFWYTRPVSYNISHPSVWSIMKGDVVSANDSWYIAHVANMGPIWGRQDPDGPHVGPMNFAIWEVIMYWVHALYLKHCDWKQIQQMYWFIPCHVEFVFRKFKYIIVLSIIS